MMLQCHKTSQARPKTCNGLTSSQVMYLTYFARGVRGWDSLVGQNQYQGKRTLSSSLLSLSHKSGVGVHLGVSIISRFWCNIIRVSQKTCHRESMGAVLE